MNKSTTLTLKIINDQDVLDTLPKGRQLTEDQKELIKLVAKTAVDEYIQQMKHTQQSRTTDRIMRLHEVKDITGLSRSTIYKHVNKGTFPKPITIGDRSVGWKESQITDWISSRHWSPA